MPARTTGDCFLLRENHRASKPLIDFVNAFSREVLRADSDELFEARYVEESESLVAARREAEDVKPVTWLRPPGEDGRTTRVEDAEIAAAYVAETVSRERVAFRDFAILGQSTEMLDAAAFAMARLGIPHVVAGRGFFLAREVQDLLWVLRWIERPSDRVALLSVLRGPCAALGDRTLLALTEPHRGLVTSMDRWDELERRTLIEGDDREALARARTTLRELARAAERVGPGRTLREAVAAFEIERTLLLMPRGPQRIANVRKLLRIADTEPTIRSLLERVARAEERAREPEAATFAEDDDAVRLLTVHASKGLAFRIVILPELRAAPVRSASTTFGVDLRASQAWLATKVLGDDGEPVTTPSFRRLVLGERARARADRRRLMYVAVTRAKERIVFVGGAEASKTTEPSFGGVIPGLATTGAIEVRDVPIEPTLTSVAAAPREVALKPAPVVRTTEITIAPTAVQDFEHCERRFELVHLLGLPEPTPRALGRFRGDGSAEPSARREGTALHALLERIEPSAFGAPDAEEQARNALSFCHDGLDEAAEARIVSAATRFLRSEYALRIVTEAEIVREHAFVVTLSSPVISVTLRGAMDLVVRWPNGDVDIIDYKSARGPDERPHGLQLDVYAWAIRREGATGRVRSGAMFLGGEGPCEPRFRAPVAPAKLEARLLELGERLDVSRDAASLPRARPKTCHAIGCGYFSLCHPPAENRQLLLFPGTTRSSRPSSSIERCRSPATMT
jgi:ATP-dependent helicase/nuclease subunit A